MAARGIGGDAEFGAGVELPEEFLRAAEAGLAFARDRPHLLRYRLYGKIFVLSAVVFLGSAMGKYSRLELVVQGTLEERYRRGGRKWSSFLVQEC